MNYNIKVNEHNIRDFYKDCQFILKTVLNERYTNPKFKVESVLGVMKFQYDLQYSDYLVKSYEYSSDDYFFNNSSAKYAVDIYEFSYMNKFLFSVITIFDGVSAPMNYRISDEIQMCKLRLSFGRDVLPSFVDDVYIVFNN